MKIISSRVWNWIREMAKCLCTKEVTSNSISPVSFQCQEKFCLTHHLLIDSWINGNLIIPKYSFHNNDLTPTAHYHPQTFWICDFLLGRESQSQNTVTKVRSPHSLTFVQCALKSCRPPFFSMLPRYGIGEREVPSIPQLYILLNTHKWHFILYEHYAKTFLWLAAIPGKSVTSIPLPCTCLHCLTISNGKLSRQWFKWTFLFLL